jgi:hypothetical protein
MKENNTYLLKLGFNERGTNIGGKGPMTDNEIREWVSAYSPEFKEEAITEIGNLKDSHKIGLKINAPAFTFDFKEYQIDIYELATTPLKIPCIPRQKGDHYLVFDFYDSQNQRCGGISIPQKVREREPFFSERVARTVQILGGLVGLVSAVILIFEKVKPYLVK